MRNAIHQRLALLTSVGTTGGTSPHSALAPEASGHDRDGDVPGARGRLGSTPGHVVAALPFGFWVGLLSSGGVARLRDEAVAAGTSPGVSATIEARGGRVHQRLVTMRLFRNRIAHHEPIHYRHLRGRLRQRMLTIVGWVSADFAGWVAARSRVPALLATKPAT